MSATLKAHIALFLVALFYGANYTIAKVVLDDGYIGPKGFIIMRVVAAFLFFTLFHFLFIKEKVDKADFGRLVLCGIFGVAINQIFFFSGLKFTTPINASLMMMTTPILVLLSSAFLIGERITLLKIIGIIMGISGATALITYGKEVSFQSSQLLGDLFILINAASYGIYLVVVKPLMQKYHPITVVRWVFSIGLVLVIPFGWSELSVVEWSSFSQHVWLAVLYVLIFSTILTYLFNAYALKIVNPSVVSIYIYLQPLIAAVIALIFVKDELTWYKIVAAVFIFAGVYLVSKPDKAPKS